MVHFGLRHRGDCMNNITETMNDNIANFPDGLHCQTRMQLLAWVLQVPSTNRNCGCQSENQNDQRDPHIRERLDHPGHILQPLEHKTPSLKRKMKTYLELEGKLGNQSCTNIFSPNKNSSPRKTPAPKKAEMKRAKVPMKRRFKIRVITQPMPANPS